MTPSFIARAAGLVVIAALQAYWYFQPAPLLLKLLVVVFTGLALASPALALVSFAFVAPFSTSIAAWGGGPKVGGLLLEQLILGIGAGTLLRRGTGERTRIGAPALIVSVVALASAAAMLPAAAAATAPPGLENQPDLYLRLLESRADARYSRVWSPVFAALMVAECALLAWCAERIIRSAPYLAIRTITAALAGHAVVGLLALVEIIKGSLTGPFLENLRWHVSGVRLNPQMEVHAAGSATLLSGISGVGLLRAPRSRRTIVALLLALVFAGFWIAGSRPAMIVGAATGIAALIWLAVRVRPVRVMGWLAAIAVAGTTAWIVLSPLSARHTSLSYSFNARVTMLQVGMTMFRSAPVFGIGIWRFYDESANVGVDLMPKIAYDKQNAHNNFMQVLAEQGVVGLLAMLWWLAAILVPAIRTRITEHRELRIALTVGVLACVATWIAGHPLLIIEFASVFWLYLGVLAATTPPPSMPRWPVWVVVGALVASVVPRAIVLRDNAELEHLGFGLSIWHRDQDQRYREGTARFALYIAASGTPVRIPVRRAPGAPETLTIDARLHGALIQTVHLSGDGWGGIEITVPAGRRKFELVTFSVSPTGSNDDPLRPVVWVGYAAAPRSVR